MILAYLTSRYARASDSFIRTEVAELRRLGHTVHTFSIRKPGPDELTGDDVRAEHARTVYLLDRGAIRLLAAAVAGLLRAPRRSWAAFRVAMRTSAPGVRARVWQLAYLVEAAALARELVRLRVEHLHDHIGENSAAVAMLASTLTGIPWSLTIHGPGEFFAAERLALAEKIARATFTVCVSDFGRSQCVMVAPDAADRIHVVRCAVEPAFLAAPPTPVPRAPRLVCVGRLAPEKGTLVLLDAVAELVRDGVPVELELVGDGPLRAAIEARIAALGLASVVRLAGWQPAAVVRRRIEAARALVLPSFAEGLPIVLMEALALGRPAVATFVAGIPELVEPGVSGWLVPAGAVEPLADALAAVLRAPVGELERMGRAGAALVAERHDPAAQARRLDALFHGGTSAPPRTAAPASRARG